MKIRRLRTSVYGLLLLCLIPLSSSATVSLDEQDLPLRDKIIVVDPGHGGSDPGACKQGIKEKDLTLQISLKLQKELQALGATVIMTRIDDRDSELEERLQMTLDASPDLFISIHVNAMPNSKRTTGIETYFRTGHDHSRLLAHTIHAVCLQELNVADKKVKTARFYVTNLHNVPSILFETGFITNENDRKNLANPEYQAKMSRALASGILRYWEKTSTLYPTRDLPDQKSEQSGQEMKTD